MSEAGNMGNRMGLVGKYLLGGWRVLLWASILAFLLTMGFEKSAQAAFPGTNGKIVFQGQGRSQCSCSTEGNGDIYTMNRDGSALTNITANSSALERDPKLSPDGAKIVFEREQNYSRPMKIILSLSLSRPLRCTRFSSVSGSPLLIFSR